MKTFSLSVNNSFCKFSSNIPQRVSDSVKKLLTYRNDIDAELSATFNQLRYFQKIKNTKKANICKHKIKTLKANEWICWYDEKSRSFPTGHLNMVKDLLEMMKIDFDLKELRKRPINNIILPWVNRPPKMRYYQKDATEKSFEEGRGVIEASVGSGKTLMMTYLIKQIAVDTLVVVPSRGLLEQIYEELKICFGSKVQKLDTKAIRSQKELKPIKVATIQTLSSLNKTDDLEYLTDNLDAIFIDEIHHSGSSSYLDLLKHLDHVYWRFGFSGTFLRNDGKSLDMWGFLSNVIYRYPAWKGVEDGFLTPVTVKVHSLIGKRSSSYPKEYESNYCGKPEISSQILNIIRDSPKTDQILILVNRKDKAGKLFHELLNSYGINNSYISGDNKSEAVTQAIQDFNDGKINILIGSSVIGEGIDVRSANQLIMAQGGKSEIVIVQAVGRLVRLFEGKDVGLVHDFQFEGTKYMTKHLKQRLDIYERNFQAKIEEE